MNDAGRPNRTNRPSGFTLHAVYFVYAAVAVLAIIFGWVVLAVFAVLMTAAWLFAWFDDRRHQTNYIEEPVPDPRPQEGTDDTFPDQDGNCPTCGSVLFVAARGVTTVEEIMAFSRQAEGWKNNPEAIAGWMPAGIYCPQGCYAIHTTPTPDSVNPVPVADPDGIPQPARIRFADVMRDGGSYTLCYESVDGDTVQVLLRVITTSKLRRTGYNKPQLMTVDPATFETRSTREIDWDAAARLSAMLKPLFAGGGITLGGAPRASATYRCGGICEAHPIATPWNAPRGAMKPEIVTGDILDQDVEVIVNSWNRNVIPWWLLLPQGVSGAIKKKGGTLPFREVARCGPIPLGEARLTSAGKLPFKAIIHVAGINLCWFATETSVRHSVINAMRLVASRGFSSIAFPLIGSGSGNRGKAWSLKLMLEAFESIDGGAGVVVVRYE